MSELRLNVLGLGVMGRQIASLFSLLGYDVTVWNRTLDDGRLELCKRDGRLLQKRFGTVGDPGTVRFTTHLDELEPGTTYEVLVEDLTVKRDVLAHVSFPLQDVVVLTNTSSYAPGEILDGAIGLHFFNPIHALRFAEVTSSLDRLPPAVLPMVERLRGLGFELIHTDSNRGYVGNFILFHEIAASMKLMDRHHYGTTVIDRVLSHMGRTVSLFDVMDIVGVDVVRRILVNLREDDPSIYVSPRLDAAVAGNILGRRNKTSIRDFLDGQEGAATPAERR